MNTRNDPRVLFAQTFKLLSKEKNPEKITVKEITEITGYSRKNFYYYFHDKEEMIAWYFNYEGDVLFKEKIETHSIQDILTIFTKDIKDNYDYYLYVFNTDGQNSLYKQYLFFCERLMREMFIYKSNNHLTADQIFQIHFIAFGNVGSVCDWVNNGCRETAEDLFDRIASCYPESLKKYVHIK